MAGKLVAPVATRTETTMSMLDLARFRATPLTELPYPHLVVPGFLKSEACAEVHRDYPQIDRPGSFPTSELDYGAAFTRLLGEIEGPEMREAFEDKFGVDLRNRPTMVTVRGMAQARMAVSTPTARPRSSLC